MIIIGEKINGAIPSVEKAIAAGMKYPQINQIILTLFSTPALKESLIALQKSYNLKEFWCYQLIWNLKIPCIVYISVVLRKWLKHAMGR